MVMANGSSLAVKTGTRGAARGSGQVTLVCVGCRP